MRIEVFPDCAGADGPFQECGLTDKGMDKEDVVYITMEYYPAIKKNEIMPLAATWMDLESVTLSEVCQTEEEKYMTSLICGI